MEQSPTEIAVPVVEAVSDAVERPIEELPPLSRTIDIDALEALATSTATDPPRDVTVTFAYAGARVCVHSGKTVYARPTSSDSENPFERGSFDEG